ncbi:hypothetical protein A3709_19390 [Halioglobus sp. HI00S01]|uniref:hypothetical protein n=1 Tax=Halioglobus sp. HI00S01 TaxID=1822214 RepID=UPI0007C33D9B|nr:hypothetical protein [Halioglobus sp. HI00S01]KZX57789.1 hypothetical protein A3709_19390 [Halioglobus sp. HI00S01]
MKFLRQLFNQFSDRTASIVITPKSHAALWDHYAADPQEFAMVLRGHFLRIADWSFTAASGGTNGELSLAFVAESGIPRRNLNSLNRAVDALDQRRRSMIRVVRDSVEKSTWPVRFD